MTLKRLLMFTFFLFSAVSCENKARTEVEAIVKKWIGKEIRFPDHYQTQYLGRDTVFHEVFDRGYKIFLYVDSVGCTSCRLGLFNWYQRIQEADTLAPGRIGFVFFMQPKKSELKELEYLTKRDNFRYPIFIDPENNIGRLNDFESDPRFQCFLLDRENQIVAIGNPKENPLVWDLYKEIVTGEKADVPQSKTIIEIDRQDVEVADMKLNETSEVVFTMTNMGNMPLVVYHVESSCGCTVPQWDRKPVSPGGNVEIKVLVTPDVKGFFNKSIDIYANTDPQRIKCNIHGVVE